MKIELKLGPDPSEIEAVVANISSHAEQVRPGANYRSFGFLLRHPDSGAVAGGLTGHALYDWMFVQYLSVPEELRGQGYGRRLMAEAEAWARDNGLAGMWLDTFAFQAPEFYEKLGFTNFGTIEDHPRGSRRHFFAKRFGAPID